MRAARRAWLAALAAAALATALLTAEEPAPAASGRVLVVGDSLVVGTTPYLRRELSGVSVTSDGRIGRPSTEAVSVLRSKLTGGERAVVFDAGVNDDPAQPSRLASDLAAARSAVGDTCLVVATVSRPPYRGVSVDGLNRAVRSFAAANPTVQLVDWRAAATSNPRLLNSDGVHPTASGYAFRARLFAEAIAACGTGGGAAPDAAPPPDAARDKPPRPRRHRKKPKPPEPEPERPKPTLDTDVLTDEPVTFRSGDTKLEGELLAPARGDRHPAVVMIQDAGRQTRERYREQGEYLAEHGVAALIYDKRKTGHSYDELTGDARAAVALLKERPDVSAIGVWGLGEGGLIAPRVAAGNDDVKAVMVVSPQTLAPASQQEWRIRRRLRDVGIDGGTGPVSTWYSLKTGLDGDLAIEPAEDWRRVTQPVLAAWGSDDRVLPARRSAEALRLALADGPNQDRTFRTFEGADHGLGVEREGYRPGTARGFKELSATWLADHLGDDPPEPRVDAPLPPPDDRTDVHEVQNATLLDSLPAQLAWLILPALGLAAAAVRRRREVPDARTWLWLGAVVALDLAALAALAYAVASLVDGDGRPAAVAGMPAVVLLAWALTIAAAAATVALRRRRSVGRPATAVSLASAAWLLLALYWLV